LVVQIEETPVSHDRVSTGLAEPSLEWSVHLARGEPRQAAGALLATAGAGIVVWSVFGNPLMGLAAVAVILGSIAEFLFPIRHRLTAQGAEVRFGLSRSFIAWSQVRKCYLSAEGLKLSPLPSPHRLEVFRGVFLRFADNKDQVIDFVRRARHVAGH
jgi:hypothetical protein